MRAVELIPTEGSGRSVSVDVHTHFVPRAFAELLADEGAAWGMTAHVDAQGPTSIELPASSGYLVPGRLLVSSEHHDLDVRLRVMDGLGVDVQVLSAPTYLYRYDIPSALAGAYVGAFNDALVADLGRSDGRFWGLALLPLQNPEEAVREVERLAGSSDILGFSVGTRIGEVDLDHEGLRPVWAAIERYEMPVLVHPNHTDGAARMQDHLLTHLVGLPGETALAAARLILGGRLDEASRLKICLAHAGGTFPLILGRIESAFHRMDLRARCARPPAHYVDRLMVDSVAHGESAVRLVLEVFGAGSVLLGSDFPARTGLADPVGTLRSLGLGPDDEARIRGGNAMALKAARIAAIPA